MKFIKTVTLFLICFFICNFRSIKTSIFYNINNQNLHPSINQRDFIINADPPINEDWKPTGNSQFLIKPDDYGIDSDGCYSSHYWDESISPSQNRPSIHWERNFSLIEDITNITSASVNAVVNATVHANNGSIAGVDCPGDSFDMGFIFDYVRFYIIISDLEKTNEYQIAYLQTTDLGKDNAGTYDFLLDSHMINLSQAALIFFIGKVLESENQDFTVAMGIDINCEANYFLNDIDYWDILRIKSFDLTFTYKFQSHDTKPRIEGYNFIYLISIISISTITLIIYLKKKYLSL